MRTIYILFQQIKDEFQDYDNSGQFRSLQVQSYPVLKFLPAGLSSLLYSP